MKIQKLLVGALFATLLFTTSCKKSETVESSNSMDSTAMAQPEMVTDSANATMSGDTKMVGGAEMYPTKNIIENAVNSKDHTTLVAAVKAAGLVETLSGPGPFTVFAPTNEAFAMLPDGAVDGLLKPENKKALTGVLTYHVVAGKVSAEDLMKMIKDGNGKATLSTVAGGKLTASEKDGKVYLTDEKGGEAMVTIADVNQSNGVIHVVDHILMPK
ncbi:Uncaracterized surface protein containing fasciclin (FAS1) repeats [Halpernia frigidisoli]|uniref:Uncaracterized surface protein containing fasciclin (FAS1) repeats n=2 Tax=Halpernia frigidisoli TaxID=1125876 RepID=A0A1I3E9T3_9FLAO|nr:Uncaracterized surface protein containing fasciclin (FAS1) repeats [Halpernia frigidisoli]